MTLSAGESGGAVFTVCASGGEAPAPLTVDGLTAQADDTGRFWQDWLRQSHYRGRWPELVHRSVITLKLLTYAPTGALVAAATMGLPEQVGGERNWDYRFTWVRDGALSVRAMLDLGFVEEATAFVHWLVDRLHEREGKEEEPLQTMYRIDGNPDLPEQTLDHFEGYRGSYPVRVGNGAADQLQLDIYGEALYALSQAPGDRAADHVPGMESGARTLDWLADHWDRPDEGIWETRGGRQDFTYSRVMCWVAFDHGLRVAEHFRRPADLEKWRGARDAIFEQVMERGWSEQRGRLRPALRRRCPGRLPAAHAQRSSSSPRGTRPGSPRSTRWTASSSRTASSTATTRRHHRTGCAARRAPSVCAPSSTSTRWPGPGGCLRPATPSRRC